MTELRSGIADVRTGNTALPAAVCLDGVWRDVIEIALVWRVETDWWRAAVRRDYVRCLLTNDECVDVYRDLDSGDWHWLRRYD